MTKSIVFIDTYYPSAISAMGFDGRTPLDGTYLDNVSKLTDQGFGTGGAYVRGMSAVGWDTQIIVPNARGVQSLWATEQGLQKRLTIGWEYGLYMARLPVLRDQLHHLPHMHRILLKQIEALKPDVILVQDLNFIPLSFAKQLKKHCRVLIGEIASPLPPKQYFLGYDMIVSALPSIVSQVREWGIESHYIPLAFDTRWVRAPQDNERPIDAIFVGSFSRHQPQTLPLLQAVAEKVPSFQIYGPASETEIEEAGLSPFYKGQAWGKEMFELLGKSKIVVNRHGTIAGPYAVNMRMFEATGCGAALVTEDKLNLSNLFEPEREVVTYTDPQHAATRVTELLGDLPQLEKIAFAGHQRTLSSHTYMQRAQHLSEIIEAKFSL